ncbi:MAG: YheU family protein [Porticoccaceae bacterium]
MIEIPPERLSPELLDAVIEDFVSREATDYGAAEVDFQVKVEQVKRQIARGEVVITFDPVTESCNLLTRHQFRQLQA